MAIRELFVSYTMPDDDLPYFRHHDADSLKLAEAGAPVMGWRATKIYVDSTHEENPIITVLVLHKGASLGQERAKAISDQAIDWLVANGHI